MTQEELAKKVGKTSAMIGFYESGRSEPSIEFLQQMSTIFDVTIDQLVNQDLSASERTSIPYGIETHLHKLEDSQQPYGTKDRVMFITDITASGGQLSGHSDGSTNGVWVSVPNAKPQSIALTVVGDSMAPIINEGDVVIGEPIALEDMRPGDIYIVDTLHDGVTVKKVEILGNTAILMWRLPICICGKWV